MAARAIRWLPVSFMAATVLLGSVLAIAVSTGESPQLPQNGPPFATGSIVDAARIFGENLLVLMLYAMGNLAASIIRRWRVRDTQPATATKAWVSRLAMATVIGLLLFAACRQAYVLGHGLAGFADYFYVSRWRLWLGVLPHALPELTGVFLPVAAWLYASRHSRQQELLAFTAVAVLAALLLLAAAALIEVYVSPKAFRALTCIVESEKFRGGGGDCGPEPQECPKLSRTEFERRYHIHLTQAEIAADRHCSASSKR
jgi:uncharacterized membrane protein SpoIIM required for sporulation